MSWSNRIRNRESGFTLIELIMVIVVMGVLAVFAAPMFNSGDFNARGFHDETLGLLRYAQKTAIAQRRTVCVALTSSGVTLTMDTKTTPDGVCNASPTLPSKPKGGTGLTSVPTSFQFTPLGATDQFANIAVSIANSTPITVEAATGFVHE